MTRLEMTVTEKFYFLYRARKSWRDRAYLFDGETRKTRPGADIQTAPKAFGSYLYGHSEYDSSIGLLDIRKEWNWPWMSLEYEDWMKL